MPKRCLYEVLAVPYSSTPDEIRSAYRRLALHLHPDKLAAANGGIATPADTALFQELLDAYEVLSDPDDRAYYDSHREEILAEPPPEPTHDSTNFFMVDLSSYFSNSAFSGYTDYGNGFYRVYGDLFAKIYCQEIFYKYGHIKYTPTEGTEKKPKPLPLRDSYVPGREIGDLDTPYSEVTEFYDHWLNFSTEMDFAWLEVFDSYKCPSSSKNLMQKENQIIRDKARNDYNELVRGLAAYTKRRDKRVIDAQNKRALEEEKRREANATANRQLLIHAMGDEELQFQLSNEVPEKSSTRREKGGRFYCVICHKKFLSDTQWKKHDKSDKHRAKLAGLKASMEISKEFERVEI